jgi:hypothetical protein
VHFGKNVGLYPKANRGASPKRKLSAGINANHEIADKDGTRDAMTKKEEKVKAEGTVVEALPGTQFIVALENEHRVLAYLSGKMR